MKKITLPFIVLASLFLSGCLTLKYDDAKSAQLLQQGYATLRGSQDEVDAQFVGPKVTRYYATEVDDPKTTSQKANDILPLTPGRRTVSAVACLQEPRFGGFDLYLFTGRLSFEARTGVEYVLRGTASLEHATLAIYDLKSGTKVSEDIQGAPRLEMVQRAPMVIMTP